MNYYLSIGGLAVLLESDVSLSVGERFRPFLISEKPWDYSFIIKCIDTLPPVPHGAITRGSVQTVWDDNGEAGFITDQGGDTPGIYYFLGESSGRLLYLPKAAHTITAVENVFHRVGMESWLLRKNALVLHAAFVKWKEKAVLLCGHSGVGKSTQAALWEQMGGSIINGDRTLLRQAGVWQAWGLPIAGTSGIYRNEVAPIAAIAVLAQGAQPALRQLSPAEAIGCLYPETAIHHWDKGFVEQATDLLLSMVTQVPVYRLTCTMGPETPALLRKKAKL